MFTEDYLAVVLKFFLDYLRYPYLLFQETGNCGQKGKPSFGCHGKICFKYSFELYEGFVIKGDKGKIVNPDTCLFKAVIYSLMGEVSVVLLPCKPLLLGSGNNFPIFDKAGCRVMIEGGDTKDISAQNCLL